MRLIKIPRKKKKKLKKSVGLVMRYKNNAYYHMKPEGYFFKMVLVKGWDY